MLTWLSGKKTYIVCAITIIYALTGGYLKFISWQDAYNLILVACGAGGFRSAISKITQQ